MFVMCNNIIKYFIWLVLSLFYSYQIIHRILTTIINDYLVLKYSMDADQIGQFAGMWYLGYVIMHIPIGIFLDHFSVKKVISFCILLTVVGFLPLLYSNNLLLLMCGRFLIGAGCAASTLGAFKLLILFFGRDKFPLMLGAMVSVGLVFGALSAQPISILMVKFGWELVFRLLLYCGLFLGLFFYSVIPNTKAHTEFSFYLVLSNFKYVISKPVIIIISVLAGLMIGPLEGFSDSWSIKYLMDVYHFSQYLSLNINKMMLIGMAVGLLILGKVFARFNSYYFLIIASGFFMLIIFLLIIMKFTYRLWLIMILFFIIGLFCSYQMIVIAKGISLVNIRYGTFVSAIMNMIMMGCGYLFHRVIGKILKYSHNLNGIYQENDYLYAFSPIIIGLIIAIIGFIYCKLKKI